MQSDQDELASLGVQPLPPEHWVYQQGTTFVVSNSPQDSSATPLSPPIQAPPLQDSEASEALPQGSEPRLSFRSPLTLAEPQSAAQPEPPLPPRGLRQRNASATSGSVPPPVS